LARHQECALLDLIAGQFEVLITTDKNLPSQQNLVRRQISVVILPSHDIPTVMGLLSQIERAIAEMSHGEFEQLR
jgi:hypothetical protein